LVKNFGNAEGKIVRDAGTGLFAGIGRPVVRQHCLLFGRLLRSGR
jgi:hypothetical protein